MPDGAARVAGLRLSSGFPASFYISVFNRCYRSGEAGWFSYRTPDDRAVMEQDSYMWMATEVIASKLNQIIATERAKHTRT